MKILLIAKPWKGGLGRYFFMALEEMFPGQVEWLSTRPETLADRIHFHRDPKDWRHQFLKKIESTSCDAAFFVGWRKKFRGLNPNPTYVLYLVDDVQLTSGDADAFGRVFLSDPGYESELRAAVQPAQYGGVLPFAHHPAVHRAAPFSGAKKTLCFIGNRDPKRDPYIERLFTEGFSPLIVGNYFAQSPLFWRHPLHFRRAVANDLMGDVYARHAASLNIHAQVVRQGTNMRTFECAGYGIPQLVEYRPGIENYFEPEKEIACFRDADEMTAKLRLLIKDPTRAHSMAEAARRRAVAEHTYRHRLAAALGHLLLFPKML